jgi:hypothetical protein
MKRRQIEWKPGGWFIMLTIGQGWGLGFAVTPPLDSNGADFFLGPVILTVQPPMPARYKHPQQQP